jgi:hypothetical protein
LLESKIGRGLDRGRARFRFVDAFGPPSSLPQELAKGVNSIQRERKSLETGSRMVRILTEGYQETPCLHFDYDSTRQKST